MHGWNSYSALFLMAVPIAALHAMNNNHLGTSVDEVSLMLAGSRLVHACHQHSEQVINTPCTGR
jgi:hypothetical protein